MKTLIQLLSLSLLMVISVSVKSQQIPNFNLYQAQHFLLNPAYAGEHEFLQGFIDSKRQWVGVPDAPVTSVFGLHQAVNDKVGLGVQFSSDQAALLDRIAGNLNYSYKVKLSNTKPHFMVFGASLGFVDNKIRFDEAIGNPDDPRILEGNNDGIALDASFGVRYSYSDFTLGFAIPQILNSELGYEGFGGNEYVFDLKNHFILHSSYRFRFYEWKTDENGMKVKSETEKFSLQPSLLFRALPYIPFQVDAGLTFRNASQQWLGLIYRPTSSGVVVTAGLPLLDNLHVGYAYEFNNSKLSDYSNGTHEFMLVYNFRSKKQEKKARDEKEWKELMEKQLTIQKAKLAQQMDSMKLDLSGLKNAPGEDAASQDLKEKVAKLETELNLLRAQSGQSGPSGQTNVGTEAPVTDLQLRDQVVKLQQEIMLLKSQQGTGNPVGADQSQINDLKRELDDLKRFVKTIKGEDVVELRTVKDANNNEILVEDDYRDGCYVVIHSLRSLENAKRAIRIEKEKGHEASILFNKTRQWYYIYVYYNAELQPALVKMKEVRRSYQPEAWVHIYRH